MPDGLPRLSLLWAVDVGLGAPFSFVLEGNAGLGDSFELCVLQQRRLKGLA